MLHAVEPLLQRLARPLVRLLARTGVSPDALTLAGLVGNAGVGVLLALGQPTLGGVALLLVNLLDLLDGEVARATGRASPFGAFLDSVADRYCELVVLFGLSLWYVQAHDPLGAALAFLVLGGSTLVSYVRARAEGLGYRGAAGLVGRLERVLLLGLGLLVAPLLPWVLAAMALLTHLTVLQRVLYVRRQMAERGG
jgi:CDP-diacylglycerol---glycerol-3-phosphate 3-phosphatidyltransferase